eukprot:Skav210709  [mRNA]  locus=scaffold1582:105725:107193:+ [translate_table: standard]
MLRLYQRPGGSMGPWGSPVGGARLQRFKECATALRINLHELTSITASVLRATLQEKHLLTAASYCEIGPHSLLTICHALPPEVRAIALTLQAAARNMDDISSLVRLHDPSGAVVGDAKIHSIDRVDDSPDPMICVMLSQPHRQPVGVHMTSDMSRRLKGFMRTWDPVPKRKNPETSGLASTDDVDRWVDQQISAISIGMRPLHQVVGTLQSSTAHKEGDVTSGERDEDALRSSAFI